MNRLVGSVEAGGTKFVCAVGTGPEDLRGEVRFPTKNPAETLTRTIDYFRQQQTRHGPLAAIGVGCFGPLDLDRSSPSYGRVDATPKPGWSGTSVAGTLTEALGLPVAIDTDVNVAALGEGRWGAAQGLDAFVYLTIGTGIGGGGMIGDELLHGLIHPEMGHMKIPRDPARDPYAGWCTFHGDCLEGLAAGPAIGDRWGRPAQELPADHPAWELEAEYLALGVMNILCVLSPQRVIMGGGVMEQAQLLPLVRAKLLEQLGGYLRSPAILERIDEFVVAPKLGNKAGILGGLALAQRQLQGVPGRRIEEYIRR
jgi:fructokinase